MGVSPVKDHQQIVPMFLDPGLQERPGRDDLLLEAHILDDLDNTGHAHLGVLAVPRSHSLIHQTPNHIPAARKLSDVTDESEDSTVRRAEQ
jgi:hypothetical protein